MNTTIFMIRKSSETQIIVFLIGIVPTLDTKNVTSLQRIENIHLFIRIQMSCIDQDETRSKGFDYMYGARLTHDWIIILSISFLDLQSRFSKKKEVLQTILTDR